MKIVVLICVCMTRSILIDAKKVGFMSCYNLFYVLIISLSVSICSKMHYPPLRCPTTVTAKPKTSRPKQNTSRQNRKPLGKNKNLTAKPKPSRQNQRLHSKNQIPHGKSKYPRQKPKLFWFCREVFGFSLSAKCRNHAIATNNAFEANTSLLSPPRFTVFEQDCNWW